MVLIKNEGPRGKKHNSRTLSTSVQFPHLTVYFSSASLQASLRSMNARNVSK